MKYLNISDIKIFVHVKSNCSNLISNINKTFLGKIYKYQIKIFEYR